MNEQQTQRNFTTGEIEIAMGKWLVGDTDTLLSIIDKGTVDNLVTLK